MLSESISDVMHAMARFTIKISSFESEVLVIFAIKMVSDSKLHQNFKCRELPFGHFCAEEETELSRNSKPSVC